MTQSRDENLDTTLTCKWVPSPNFTARRPETNPPRQPDMLILHYTGMVSSERALYWLTTDQSEVSCHYMIDEDGNIFQSVREEHRAWQAGLSFWQGDSDINSTSIGIEIHNEGSISNFPEFPEPQMAAVTALCQDILARNAIPQNRVLAHSDIAPGRKIDPGPKFDWKGLAASGVGLWPEAVNTCTDTRPDMRTAQQRLAEIGYKIEVTGEDDEQTRTVISAFQLHFRASCYDGTLDPETAARIADVWGVYCAVG